MNDNDKRIILITGNTETLSYFSKELAFYLYRLGREIFIWDMTKPSASIDAFATLPDKDRSVLVTFNFIGLNGEGQFGGGLSNIWEEYGIEVISIMVDSPIYYYRQLDKYRDISVACIDRNHARYVKKWHPYIKNVYFWPLCGNEPILDLWMKPGIMNDDTIPIMCRKTELLTDADSLGDHGKCGQENDINRSQENERPVLSIDERPIDIVFVANLVTQEGINKSIEGADSEYREFLHDICEQMIAHPDLVLEDTLYSRLIEEFPDEPEDSYPEAMFHMVYVDLYVRSHFRARAVRTLVDAGYKVYCVGQDWDKLECAHPENLIHTDVMLTSADCIRALENSKISLNVMPHFKAGAHDRVFSSMLAGCGALTDPSEYLDEVITPWEDYVPFTLDEPESIIQSVCKLRSDRSLMSHISETGRKKAKKSFTWLATANSILSGGIYEKEKT